MFTVTEPVPPDAEKFAEGGEKELIPLPEGF